MAESSKQVGAHRVHERRTRRGRGDQAIAGSSGEPSPAEAALVPDVLLERAVQSRLGSLLGAGGSMVGQVPRQVAPIPPLVETKDRPTWSVIIPAFEPAVPPHLALAVESVLQQRIPSTDMEILVVDDGSRTSIVREIAATYAPRVSFVQLPEHLGLPGSFNHCLRLSRGVLVHLLHQDDYVEDGFYEAVRLPLLAKSEVSGAFCRFLFIDHDGRKVGLSDSEGPAGHLPASWMQELAAANLVQCPSIVVARSAYEAWGGYDESLRFAFDWELWARLHGHVPLWYEPGVRAAYRIHQASTTFALSFSTRLADILLAESLILEYLEPGERLRSATQLVRRVLFDGWREAIRCGREGRHDDAGEIASALAEGWASALEAEQLDAWLRSGEPGLEPSAVPHRLDGKWQDPEAWSSTGNCDSDPRFVGGVDAADSLSVKGWVHEVQCPDASLQVQIVFESLDSNGTWCPEHVTTSTANHPRPDLSQAGIGDHAFDVKVPFHLLDGGRKRVRVTVAEGTQVGIPVEFVADGIVLGECASEGDRIVGQCFMRRPERRPLEVFLRLEDEVVLSGSVFGRSFLEEMGFDCTAFFELVPPQRLRDGRSRRFTVGFGADGAIREVEVEVKSPVRSPSRRELEKLRHRGLAVMSSVPSRAPGRLRAEVALDFLSPRATSRGERLPQVVGYRAVACRTHISLIVWVGDDAQATLCCLATAMVALVRHAWEVVLVPGQGGRLSKAQISSHFPGVRVLEPQPHPRESPAAWLQAAAALDTTWMLCLCDSVLLYPEAADELLAAIQAVSADSAVPQLLSAAGWLDEEAPRVLGMPDDAYGPFPLAPSHPAFSYRRTTALLSPFALLARRNDLLTLGSLPSGAEAEWPRRFLGSGARSCVYVPAARGIRCCEPADLPVGPGVAFHPTPRTRSALYVDYGTPAEGVAAGADMALAEMSVLQELGFQVHFAPTDLEHSGRATEALQRRGIQVLYRPEYDSWESIAKRFAAVDLIQVNRYYVAERAINVFNAFCPRAVMLLNMVDLHSVRRSRQGLVEELDGIGSEVAALRRREVAVAALFDCTLVYSAAELGLLREIAPWLPTALAPWYAEPTASSPAWDQRTDIVFLGSYSHQPNVDAARFLVHTIMPILRSRGAGLKVHLYGSAMPAALQRLAAEDVIVHGYAGDLAVALGAHLVMAAPLRFGAGLKGKVTAAMAHGLPTVLSSIAAEGIDPVPGVEALIADRPEDFAEALMELALDSQRWEQVALAARNLVARRYSRAAGVARMEGLLRGLGVPF